MTAEINELRSKRLNIVNQMQDFATRSAKEGDSVKRGELMESFEKAEAEERTIGQQIEMLELVEKRKKEAAAIHQPEETRTKSGKTGIDSPEYREAFESFYRYGDSNLNREQREILAVGRSVEQRGTNPQSTTGNMGGYTIPTGFFAELITSMKQYASVIEASRTIYTDSGQVLYLSTLDDTATSAALTSENATVTVADMTFGQKQLDAYLTSTMTKASLQLMQDSAFNVEDLMVEHFGHRLGRQTNALLTTGTGSGQANGIVTAASAGVTSAGASAIAFNDVLGLIHSVDPAYRYKASRAGFQNRIEKGQGNVGFMLHDNVLLAIKKVAAAAGSNSPLWMPSLRDGDPDTIFGYPYWINQNMADAVATTNITMLFGDFSQYWVRIVKDVTVRRLDERFADALQVGFLGYMRFDGELMNTAAVKKLTQA